MLFFLLSLFSSLNNENIKQNTIGYQDQTIDLIIKNHNLPVFHYGKQAKKCKMK
jgi:hypothetical protein